MFNQTRLARSVAGILLMASPALHANEDLMAIYDLAVQNDTQLRAAEQALMAGREAEPQARSQLLPQIGAQASLERVFQDNDAPSPIEGDFNRSNLGLSLTQPLYRRDRLIQLEQAGTQVQQAEINYAATEQDLMLRVAEAYFGVLKAEEELRFAEANRTAIERQYEQTNKRFEVGLIAITDVHEARARLDQSVSQVLSAQNQLDSAYEALSVITGKSHEELADLIETIPLVTPEPNDLEAWENIALEQNLQLHSQRLASEIARQEIERNRSGHYPTVDLVASYGRQDSKLLIFGAEPLDSESSTAAVGVELNLPIYTGGAVSSQTREAVYLFQQSQEDLEGTQRQTRRQTRDAYRGVMVGISQVKALKQALTSAETALEATEAGFEVGTRTIVDVLDAERARLQAKRDYENSRYDYLLNTLRLKQAAGTLSVSDLEAVTTLLQD